MIDSMWGLAVEQLQGEEANFAKATQESKVIAGAAATAAATYGGPAGAAAYAAWATNKTPKAKKTKDTIQCEFARDVDCISKMTFALYLQVKILNDANVRPRIDTT